MTPEEKAQLDTATKAINDLSQKMDDFNDLFHRMDYVDKFYLTKPLVLRNTKIRIEGTEGLKIGENATDKLGVYGVTAVVQAGAITSPTGGGTQDSQARTAIDAIRTALKNFGITL